MGDKLIKRWGSEEILFFGAYMLKQLVLDPGQCTSMHFHYAKCETLYVLRGSLVIEFEERKTVYLERDESLTIYEGKSNAHRMRSAGGCVYLEASTPHRHDSERI
jgi:mannose-6-phosphate isomerase-like protein (cupin superfamily)